MTTPQEPVVEPGPNWKKRGLIALAVAIVLVGGFFFCTEFLPRWWGRRIADQVHGTFRWGVWWGLFYGVIFTVVPIVVARLAFYRPWSWKTRVWVLVVGAVLAAPNLMTAGIVWGGSSGAHDGSATMDLRAPGFRGASLVGVIIGLVLAVLIQIGLMVRRRHNAELRALRVEKKVADTQEP
ncbi:MAG TPA: hypothetical protein VGL26_03435 [Jatrophihabitans sp.]|jgi:hypothetical protein